MSEPIFKEGRWWWVLEEGGFRELTAYEMEELLKGDFHGE